MTISVLVHRLSRHGRRRIGFGWMATAAAMVSTGVPQGIQAAKPSSTAEFRAGGESYGAMKELTARIRRSEYSRTARTDPLVASSSTSPVTKTKSESTTMDEKRLQSELAAEICRKYSALPTLKLPLSTECERMNILMMLACECSPTDDNVHKAVAHYMDRNHASPSTRWDALATSHLRKACTPVFEEVLEYILRCDTRLAIPFLIKLREDTLRALQWMRSSARDDERMPHLEDLDAYLLRIFALWFSPGMLELKRITYEGTPASVIEFIATKEAVHPMKSLDDLRVRLGAGRRVLSLFHPMLENHPLLFVHAALTHEIPSSMDQVMELLPQERPSCATFYSITNAQPGLAGIGLGEHLLKESIAFLQSEFPSLVTFVTLSPMPKFRKWLEEKVRQNDEKGKFLDDSILSKEDWDNLVKCGLLSSDDSSSWKSFLNCLDEMNLGSESGDPEHLAVLQPILTKLAARYIFLEKHRGKPLDGVARFHLGNGAMVHRINFGADLSRKGIQNSFGIMVNYLYDLNVVADNRREFEQTYQIQASSDVMRLLAVGDSRIPGQISKL